MSRNEVQIEGNLTREPELKLVGDKTVMNFGIAYNTRKKDSSGNWVDGDPMFFNVEFWPNDPKYWSLRLTKGTPVLIIGSLKFEKWEKDGQSMSAVRIRAQEIKSPFVPTIEEQQANRKAPAQSYTPAPHAQPAPASDGFPEDMPF